MTASHPIGKKSIREVAREWDAISSVRSQQLAAGIDPSYDSVLVPTVRELLGLVPSHASLLDVGCGTGVLTSLLATEARRTVAVDPSHGSIAAAQRRVEMDGLEDKVDCFALSMEEYADSATEKFDLVVANMTLMDAPDLKALLRAVSHLAKEGATFVWTVTHPWFWPYYRGYEREPWFRYDREQFIEGEFKISNDSTGLTSTHVHRPLHQYVHELAGAGFIVDAMKEPMPDSAAMTRYPQPWDFPRFLAARCVRVSR